MILHSNTWHKLVGKKDQYKVIWAFNTLFTSNEHYQMFTGKPKQKYRYDKSIELYKTLLKPSHLF